MQNRQLYMTRKKRISLTALIDVVFILLLFFMLTSSFSHWKALDLDVASSGSHTSKATETTTLLLTQNAGVLIAETGRQLSHYKQLDQRNLQNISKPNAPFVLLPYKDIPIQTVIEALQHIKSTGHSVKLGNAYGDELSLQ